MLLERRRRKWRRHLPKAGFAVAAYVVFALLAPTDQPPVVTETVTETGYAYQVVGSRNRSSVPLAIGLGLAAAAAGFFYFKRNEQEPTKLSLEAPVVPRVASRHHRRAA
jgi:hypothetical protein